MMLIMLYGALGKQFGRVHRYSVKTPREAIKAMCVTLPGFRKAMGDGYGYRLLVGGRDDLDLQQTCLPISPNKSLRIVPVVAGSGGLGKMIIGAALIAFSVWQPEFGAFTIGSFSTSVASIAGSIGSSLLLGGISQMLFAPPKAPTPAEAPNNQPSYLFNGAVNTTGQGNAIPLCYGTFLCGSQVISSGLDSEAIPV